MTQIFGNERPVEIDIGCGKGKFLLARAEASPEINFLGIDRVAKWMRIGEKRSQKRNLENLKFLKTECREFLAGLSPESISAFHIYFPDPWPKRRHRRRRLVSADFLGLLHSRLGLGGLIEMATDDADYRGAMKKAVEQTTQLWKTVRESVNERLAYAMLKTNYELKFEAAGRPLYYLELERG